ncbi:MAG TPA: Gfo/Idh/MocA family oxidoreductase [Candidatus Acidoferrum sp.]
MIDVGLIGFGLAGRYLHAPVIQAVPGLRLAAILQRSGDEGARACPETEIARTLDEFLAMNSLRLIVVATPNQTHFPIAQQCLEAGRDVIVDKPFTTTVQEAIDLVRIARAHGRLLTVYHNRRFDADFQALRDVVSSGELGSIIRFESHYDRFRPNPKAGAWREKPGPGSGVLFDLAPHLIDHALTILGIPTAINADARTERQSLSTDDAFDLYFIYPNGIRANLKATMMCATPRPRFVVLGDKGTFVKREFDPLENSLRNGVTPPGDSWVLEKEEHWGELTIIREGNAVKCKVPSHGDWRDFYANVRDAMLGREKLIVTPQQCVDVMVALELAQESSRSGCSVRWRDVRVEA